MATSNSLKGKVALITGAGRAGGIGASIAEKLASLGCHVVLTDIAETGMGLGDKKELETRCAEIMNALESIPNAEAGSVSSAICDVTQEDSVAETCAEIYRTHERLDIVVNNAGIGFLMASLMDVSLEDWDRVLNVNLRGPFLLTKHAAPLMIRNGQGGRIINIASQAAKSGFPHASSYVSSKHGLIGLTRVSAIELGEHGITVNAVCPNHITTGLGSWQNSYFSDLLGQSEEAYLAAMRERIPLGRPGKVTDIASMCGFLCQDEAGYITGEAINVSGGEEMH